MIFNEVYGAYYNCMADILKTACKCPITPDEIAKTVRRYAFDESGIFFTKGLRDKDWPLLDEENRSVLTYEPTMPLTTLEQKWIKAVLLDERIHLFLSPDQYAMLQEEYKEIEPLYKPTDIVVFDKYADGDDYGDSQYITNFRIMTEAIKEKTPLKVIYAKPGEAERTHFVMPLYLEYSEKNDRFRLYALERRRYVIMNLSGIIEASLIEDLINPVFTGELPDNSQIVKVRFEITPMTQERNLLERMMYAFSDYCKETVRLNETDYEMTIHYDKADETELLIRILSFGPMIKVTEPNVFVSKIRTRLRRQANCDL